MYKNIHWDSWNKEIHLWDDIEGYSKIPYKEYAYIIDPKGEHVTIDGHKVKKVNSWSDSAAQLGLVYEHDVNPTMRTLIDLYYETDDIATGLVVLPLDIEVAKEGTYSTPEEANNTITAISYYSYKEDLYYCLLLDKNRKASEYDDEITIQLPENKTKIVKAKYFTFTSEFDLLKVFLREYRLIQPDIITGWNCVSENSTVWLKDKIQRIQNIKAEDNLYDSVVNLSAFTGNKLEYNVLDKLGNSVNCSDNHIVPVYKVPKNKHINDKTIKKYYEELTISDINESLFKNNVYLIQPLRNNTNACLTYRKYIIDNFDALCKYPFFDFKLESQIFKDYIRNKKDFTYFDSGDLNIKRRFTNKWKFSLCKDQFPKELIVEFINTTDNIPFIFGSNKVCNIDISQKISNDMCQLLGFIFTDGTYSRYDNHYSYCNKVEQIMSKYYDVCLNEKLLKSNRRKYKLKWQDNCYYQTLAPNNVLRLLHPVIYNDQLFKKNLNIELLSQLSYEQFAYFMSGMIDGDGSVEDCINICNFNNKIEDNIRIILELLRWNGVISNITCKTTIRIKPTMINQRFYKNLNLYHSEKNKRLQEIHFYEKHNSSCKNTNWFFDEFENVILAKIKCIKSTEKCVDMYDLNTSTGFFISNGIKVHNCEFYDVPYLYNRITKVLGKDWANMLSPIKICKARIVGAYKQLRISIAGVSIMDSMTLYKKFTYSESPNYKLDTIAKIELGRGKVVYDGDLDQLYKTDIKKFAEYNIIDVELIVAMNAKNNLLEIALGICHKGHVPYEDYIYPSKYLDGASLVFCKRNNLVASSNKSEKRNEDDEDDPAEGAFVKETIPGLHQWIYSLDVQSLYPNLIMSINISPETKFGRIRNYDSENFMLKPKQKFPSCEIELIKDKTPTGVFSEEGFKSNKVIFNNQSDFKEYITNNNLSVSSNGILYSLNKKGLIPSILEMWFNERLEFKKLQAKYRKEGNKDLEKLYDKKQLVTKILLNSFYGVLLSPTFRFYDKENGEAVTTSGQTLLKFAMKAVNLYYNNRRIDNLLDDVVVAGDTDSLYIKGAPLVDGDITTDKINEHALNILDYLNKALKQFTKVYLNSDNCKLHFNFEKISKRALFIDAKKRYALHVVQEDGQPKDKIEIKGMDVVRSDFPKAFRKFMKEILVDILHDSTKDILNKKVQEFGYMMKNSFINDIMLPTGVKEVRKWETEGKFLKGTPVHVKASMNYNKLLDHYNIKSIPKISDGDKILWCYLTKNEFEFDSIAYVDNDPPPKVIEFITKYIDRDDLFNNTLKNKLQTFWDVLGWGAIITNENTNKFFKF